MIDHLLTKMGKYRNLLAKVCNNDSFECAESDGGSILIRGVRNGTGWRRQAVDAADLQSC